MSGFYTFKKNDTSFASAMQTMNSAKHQILKGKKIVLDPGHGGFETGAIANGIIEKEQTLAVALKTKQLLETEGATVILTINELFQDFRTLPLSERANFARQYKADLFVSIHFNSNSYAFVHGTETYYNNTVYKDTTNPYPNESKELARSIQEQVAKTAKTKNLGIKENVFHVLRNNSVPSALVEIGFLTNKEEAARIVTEDFQEQSARGIVKGIIEYVQAENR